MSSDTLSQVCYKSRCKVLSSVSKYMSVIHIKCKFLYIVSLLCMYVYIIGTGRESVRKNRARRKKGRFVRNTGHAGHWC